MSDADAPRPVTVTLGPELEVTGELIASSGLCHTLRVEERRVELSLFEVSGLDDAPAEPPAEPPPGPLATRRLALEKEGRGAALRRALFSRARIEAGAREARPGSAPPPPVRVYALLDGARAPNLLASLAERGESAPRCLYSGELQGEDAELAPYLVPFAPGSGVAEWLSEEGWGDHWGVYLLSPAAPEQLAAHLRSFLRVSGPDGAGLGFRFYDPRVLRPSLETLDAHQTATLFGGVACVDPAAPEEPFRACPLCGEAPRARSLSCASCKAAFGVSPSAPFLITSIVTEGESPATLVHHRPWPEVPPPDEDPEAPRPPRRHAERGQRGALLLELRQDQLDALSADFQRRQLRAWLLEHVQRAFPAKCAKLDAEALLERVVAGQRKAASYGLEENAHVARFVDITFLWHPEFDAHEDGPFAPILRDPELAPGEKAEELWTAARALTAEVLARRQR
jgi:hypothetical protein